MLADINWLYTIIGRAQLWTTGCAQLHNRATGCAQLVEFTNRDHISSAKEVCCKQMHGGDDIGGRELELAKFTDIQSNQRSKLDEK